MEKRKKYLVHDEQNGEHRVLLHPPMDNNFLLLVLRQDDEVLIRNCPPISARKRFTLERIIKSPAAAQELGKVGGGPSEAATTTDASSQ